MFCPFCKVEISLDELRDAIENNLRFLHIADIDIRQRDGRDFLSILLHEPYMTCAECKKGINLNQDGLLVEKEAGTKVKITVHIET